MPVWQRTAVRYDSDHPIRVGCDLNLWPLGSYMADRALITEHANHRVGLTGYLNLDEFQPERRLCICVYNTHRIESSYFALGSTLKCRRDSSALEFSLARLKALFNHGTQVNVC